MAEARRWSNDQELAIALREEPVLVSAGAGSGKTSVLVERVRRLVIEEGVDIDQLLIVTFTEAAAAEMRGRLGEALRLAAADKTWADAAMRQLWRLERAQISTLHSFCLQVIREAAGRTEADPGFRVADEDEARLLQERALDDLLEDLFDRGDPAQIDFVKRYGDERGEGALRSLIRRVYAFSRSQPDPDEWLRDRADAFSRSVRSGLQDASFADPFFAALEDSVAYSISCLIQARDLCESLEGFQAYLPVLEGDVRRLEAALRALRERDFERARALLRAPFPALRPVRDVGEEEKRRVQDLRKRAKEAILKLAAGVCGRDEAELLRELEDCVDSVRTLVRLVQDFETRYAMQKAQRGVLDFADLEHIARRALVGLDGVPTEVAAELSERFVEIMVDEYQDTSPVQDALIMAVSRAGRNVFQVGDVKQSIYRFRMAEPNLFLRRYAACQGGAGRAVHLRDNFRSRPEVVDAINILFAQLFSRELGGLAYDERQRMEAAALFAPERAGRTLAGPVEIHVLERPDGANGHNDPEDGTEDGMEDSPGLAAQSDRDEAERPGEWVEADGGDGRADPEEGVAVTTAEREALLAGRRLLQLMEEGRLVYRPESESYEPVRWRDMAVLLRAKAGRVEAFLRVFRELGIPAHGETDSGYFEGYEMEWMLSLLKVVDNPLQDIPLAAVLRSAVGGFSSEDLARLRAAHPQGDLWTAVQACARGATMSDLPQETRGTVVAPELSLRAAAFLKRLDSWRTYARSHGALDTLTRLLADTNWERYVAGLPSGAIRVANLRQLQESAHRFDVNEGGGFADFVEQLETRRARLGDAGAARTLGEQEDVVRIMTVHRSKGLEFPVVVVADLGRRLARTGAESAFRLHRDYGFGPERVDTNTRERYHTAASFALDAAVRREELAEEARILYVALTRAREKLILIGSLANATSRLEEWRYTGDFAPDPGSQAALPGWMVTRAGSALEWVLRAVFRRGPGGDPTYAVRLWSSADIDTAGASTAVRAARHSVSIDWPAVASLVPGAIRAEEDSSELVSRFRAALLAQVKVGKDAPPLSIPAKISVSEWRREAQEDTADQERAVTPFSESSALASPPLRPAFLRVQDPPVGAQRGILFHRVLQRIDLVPECVDAVAVGRMLAEGATSFGLTAEEVNAVSAEAISRFFSSPPGRRMLEAPFRVHREVPFTLSIPAAEAAVRRDGGPVDAPGMANAADASVELDGYSVVIQGTIDCLILEDDGAVIVDYKTDRLNRVQAPDELAGKYRTQMKWYKTAVERALGLSVKVVYLYAVEAATAVAVDFSEETVSMRERQKGYADGA